MAIHKVTAEWSGFTGAPGYSNFYFQPFTGGGDATAAAARVRAFMFGMAELIPSGSSIRVSGTVEVIDEATGALQSYLDGEAPPVVNASGVSSGYVGPTGGVVNWLTNTVNNGRRVRGRTFLVPFRTNAFDSSGTLTAAALTSIRTAADALITGDFESGLVVWSRPVGGAGGVAAPVVAARVPDLAAVLRSRRD